MNPVLSADVARVTRALERVATRVGVTAVGIQSSLVDLDGFPLTDGALHDALQYLIEVTDQVRQDGNRYFWYLTDTGTDPNAPARTPHPRPAPTPWHYFVVYRTNEGYIGNTQHDMPEQVTTIGQIVEIEQAIAGKLGRRNVHVTVTDYKLLTGPIHTIVVNWETDDIVDVTLDGELIRTYTYDEEGPAGIRAVLTTVDTLASMLGVTVTVVGNPGV